MSADRGDVDRNEPATAYKLTKAHERGSVVRSADVTFAAILVAAVGCLYGLGSSTLAQMAALLPRAFSLLAPQTFNAQVALRMLADVGMDAVALLAAPIAVVWAAAVLAGAAQARGVFSSVPLRPDFARINPAAGLKRVLSIRAVHELIKTTLKLGLLTTAAVVWGRSNIPEMLQIGRTSPRGALSIGVDLIGSLLVLCAALYMAFALLDWSFNRWEFARQMRMSKRELKDEHKEREGDPRIKSRLRELRLEWLKRSRSIAKVRHADVLVTNPTHYAVALEYRHGQMPAPLITAQGAGELAARMRAEAIRRRVPIVQNAPLARALFAVGNREAYVPEQHFAQVARILKWVYAARGRSHGSAAVA